jgi:hypothetical protein
MLSQRDKGTCLLLKYDNDLGESLVKRRKFTSIFLAMEVVESLNVFIFDIAQIS